MSGYWPWWLGALALGGIAVGYYLASGRTLGVSGAWERVLHWRAEREVERADAALDVSALAAALEAAAHDEFGGDVLTAERPAPPSATLRTATPVAAQAVLLASIFVGGLLAALVSGRFELRGDMGPAFAELVVHGWAMWPVLFLGGVLVGFGTRLAGGCSSGHGLSGCGRLQPSSILATAVFFGSAVGMSFLLWKVI